METPFLPATVGAECRRDLALLLATFFLLAWPTTSSDARWSPPSPPLSRSAFPPGFIFGTASSAYQYEGAASEGGRGPSNWDTLTHTRPEYIADRSNGDQAVDFYHRYEEDVHMMQDMGWDAFRFSISWSRILPNGKLTGGINKEGIRFYNNLINSLISKGLKPFVTLLHFDVPQALEDKYRGFISNEIVDDFEAYSDICFREFGDRVKHWITMNEPGIFVLGYATTSSTPGQCSQWKRSNCTEADSGLEPYIVAHNQLLAHAAAAKLYKDRYQASQKGLIGITLASNWYLPYSNSKSDKQARSRALDFMYGWFMDPLTKGEYPASMRTFVGHRLPRFTNRESRVLKGSFDFIGINYYTANYVRDNPSKNNATANYFTDAHTKQSGERNGKLIGRQAASSWLYVYPHGFEELLHYTKQKYNNPVIYITENGIDEVNDERLNLTTALEDDSRIDYHSKHLVYLEKAIREGVDVRGYFAWSFLDNFEWNMGYTVRFGLNYVDYKHGLKRYPKKSALWFQNFLKGGT